MTFGGQPLLIRTDASVHIGAGHFMRCLALAQEWKARIGAVVMLVNTHNPSLEKRATAAGIEVVHLSVDIGTERDAEQTGKHAQQRGITHVIVDGYAFTADYQKQLKQQDLILLCLDDYGHTTHYYADWILNQNITATADLYAAREPYTQLLLGPQYILLRQEFALWQLWHRSIFPKVQNVLVTFGGSDPSNLTAFILECLQHVSEALNVYVVLGSNYVFEDQLQLQAGRTPSHLQFQFLRNVSNMPALMSWADVAISGGASTCWELAFMKLPSLVLVPDVVQQAIVSKLVEYRVTHCLGNAFAEEWAQLSPETIAGEIEAVFQKKQYREQMSEQGRALVDGCGTQRVIDALCSSG